MPDYAEAAETLVREWAESCRPGAWTRPTDAGHGRPSSLDVEASWPAGDDEETDEAQRFAESISTRDPGPWKDDMQIIRVGARVTPDGGVSARVRVKFL